VALTIAVVLIGVILGLSFKALVLVPAMILGVAGIAAFGLANGWGAGSVLSKVALAALGLQIGFIVGGSILVLMQSALGPTRGERHSDTAPEQVGARRLLGRIPPSAEAS